MRDYEMDLYDLEHLIKYGHFYCDGCLQTYRHTNERLREILCEFDFKNKDVLSVLSSGDQVFSAYYLGAKNVDTFDINFPTYYVFYLRKWYLMLYKENVLSNESSKLLECLKMHSKNNEEEIEVAKVWKILLNRYNNISNLFLKNYYPWNTAYSEDIDKTVDIIRDKQANFTQLNIFENTQFNKKYDIILLSNILEFLYSESDINLIIFQNLDKLLNDGGVVVNSILNDKFGIYRVERKVFSSNFTYQCSDKKVYNNCIKDVDSIYYTYTKNR